MMMMMMMSTVGLGQVMRCRNFNRHSLYTFCNCNCDIFGEPQPGLPFAWEWRWNLAKLHLDHWTNSILSGHFRGFAFQWQKHCGVSFLSETCICGICQDYCGQSNSNSLILSACLCVVMCIVTDLKTAFSPSIPIVPTVGCEWGLRPCTPGDACRDWAESSRDTSDSAAPCCH